MYWLTANLAERRPLVIAVDDLQWADSASLRYLVYLARRLEGLPILVVLTLRSGDPVRDASVVSEIGLIAEHVRPGVLSEDAAGQLVSARLGTDADEEFVQAVHVVTGGVPFLLHELIEALAADGVAPTRAAAKDVAGLGPRTVAHATMLGLARLGDSATATAHAAAVLGPGATVNRIARLAGLEVDEALDALDALVAAHVLRPGSPVTFVHGIVQAAIYQDLGAGARSNGSRGRHTARSL